MLDLAQCWTKQPFVCIDFETTGLGDDCMPVSVAAVRFERGEEVGSFYSLIHPGMPIPAEASAIHGITDDQVDGAPTFDEVTLAIANQAMRAIPVAYHAAYDRAVFHRVKTGVSGAPLWDEQQAWLCPLVIVKDADRYVGGKGRHKLTTTCERRGVQLDDAHNALADARATGRLLMQLLASGAVKPCPLGKLLDHMAKRAAAQEQDFQLWLSKQPKREGVSV